MTSLILITAILANLAMAFIAWAVGFNSGHRRGMSAGAARGFVEGRRTERAELERERQP